LLLVLSLDVPRWLAYCLLRNFNDGTGPSVDWYMNQEVALSTIRAFVSLMEANRIAVFLAQF